MNCVNNIIAILGHDLRNPLQAVYSAGVLLEKKSHRSGAQRRRGTNQGQRETHVILDQ